MAINKNFVVKNGLEVADNLLFADGSKQKVGIGTTVPNYTLEVKGDVSLNNRLYLKTIDSFVKSTTGIVSVTAPSSITGINTSEIRIGDNIDDGPGGVLRAETKIVSIGVNSLNIVPSHTRFSTAPLTINVTVVRNETSGSEDQIIVSGGEFSPAKWIDLPKVEIEEDTTDRSLFPTFVAGTGKTDFKINSNKLVFNPSSGNLGIGSTTPEYNIDVIGDIRVSGLVTSNFIDAVSANFVSLETNDANIGILTAEIANIGILTAENANIDILTAEIANIGILTAENANIGILTADYLVSGISSLGISSAISYTAEEDITAQQYFGNGDTLVGIVTNLIPGIGIDLFPTQTPGNKGEVIVQSYTPAGKTIFVNQNGDDNNSGLTENDAKRTVKNAASIALFGDTIKIYPGTYVEDNPIVLNPTVSVEGAELRNCVITPKNPGKDLFFVNNGCHVTNLSYIGQESQDGAAIVALQPLLGVQVDRYFDAARIIRYNLDFIAAEAVGYLTSTDYQNPPFVLMGSDYSSCKDDVKDVFKAVIHDITRGGNSRCVGAGLSYYSGNSLQHIVGVKTETIDTFQFAIGIAHSCINNVLWEGNYQDQETQLRDLSIQPDPITGSNTDINSCANVLSAVQTCVGIVTTIIDLGPSAGIVTTFPGNSGIGFTTLNPITNAIYDEKSGKVTLTVPDYPAKIGDIVEIRDLEFECSSNGSPIIQTFPSGKFGFEFYIERINPDMSFDVYVGISSIPHTYVSGTGFLVNRSIEVTGAIYNNITGITTITAPGAFVRVGDLVTLRDLEFSCPSGPQILTYPSGKEGFTFKVNEVIGLGTTFVVTVGTSTLPHTYEGGGVVFPSYSRGVGPITQGPYIRNCTNFVPKSIGMKVDGFAAEPGDKDDIGVTGTMSVDSYTQFNQGGIGVSITNGAYSQLVSIFTICCDTAIYTSSGGQCDITNSNSSFGTFGLVSEGVGDEKSKSIYRYTGIAATTAQAEQSNIVVSGIGNYRPYDGQVLYFGELFFTVQRVEITNGGSGYTSPPFITFDNPPPGVNGIRAEAIATIQNGSVISIDLISTGTQYRTPPNITISGGGGSNATATAIMAPIYYTIESATLPAAGISTITLNNNLNSTVSTGTTVYFTRLSLQITSSHSFEWVGSGNDITKAKPALGGVVISENEVVKIDGGEIVYTSTDQAGNFRIGDGLVVNQLTGTVSGRAFNQSLINTVTPLIIALGN
jgi:hypothetical protein